jgi:hypothetical protein
VPNQGFIGVIPFSEDNSQPGVDMIYSVRANPVLHESDELEGQLAFIRFTADSKSGSHKEWQIAAEEIDARLHVLESSGLRYGVVSKLRAGGRVELPGTYKVLQLQAMGYRAS